MVEGDELTFQHHLPAVHRHVPFARVHFSVKHLQLATFAGESAGYSPARSTIQSETLRRVVGVKGMSPRRDEVRRWCQL